MMIEGRQATVGASVGIAVAPTDGMDADTLLKNADLALYRAKSEGRGNYHFFEKGMDQALQNRRMLEQGLKGGLARGEFRLVYQPLIAFRKTASAASRRCCAGTIPSAGWYRPSSSSRSPRRPGSSCRSANGCCGKPAWRPPPGRRNVRDRGQPVAGPVQEPGAGQPGDLGAPRGRPRPGPARARDHRIAAAGQYRADPRDAAPAAGARGPHRMDDFGTGYSSLSYLRIPVRQDQDRPLVHDRRAARTTWRSSRRSSGSAKPRHGDDGRGHRDRRTARRGQGPAATKSRGSCSRHPSRPRESKRCYGVSSAGAFKSIRLKA